MFPKASPLFLPLCLVLWYTSKPAYCIFQLGAPTRMATFRPFSSELSSALLPDSQDSDRQLAEGRCGQVRPCQPRMHEELSAFPIYPFVALMVTHLILPLTCNCSPFLRRAK